jgi:hypothetical protein
MAASRQFPDHHGKKKSVSGRRLEMDGGYCRRCISHVDVGCGGQVLGSTGLGCGGCYRILRKRGRCGGKRLMG